MITALLGLLLVSGDPAASAPAASAQQAEPAKKEKKICRVDEGNTGSRMRKKLCLTETEWEMKAQGKDAADLKTIGAR